MQNTKIDFKIIELILRVANVQPNMHYISHIKKTRERERE